MSIKVLARVLWNASTYNQQQSIYYIILLKLKWLHKKFRQSSLFISLILKTTIFSKEKLGLWQIVLDFNQKKEKQNFYIKVIHKYKRQTSDSSYCKLKDKAQFQQQI